MKCHYEVLGLSFSATSDEIKKAHRKLALEWHPDKNLQRAEEAKEEFQLIQQAYEILSDLQERAWYDRHRDEILAASHADTCKDDAVDVYQYFNTGCFKGYNDDEKGFYTIYRDVFQRIAAEDERYRDEEDLEIPDFGCSDSSYEDVVHNFYAYWQSYCTAKSFVWVEKHNLSEHRKAGVGRQILRIVEKENKKLRDQFRKQRNEEVKQLVSFVRKRDKRVQAHKKVIEAQNVEKTKKFQEQRKKQMEDRQRHLESYQESEWASMSQLEDHFNEIEANLDCAFGSEDAGADYQGLYCAACDKDFRSSKSLENHLKAKRHKENVLLLKHIMLDEEEMQNSYLSCENGDVPDMSYYGDVPDMSYYGDINSDDNLSEDEEPKKKNLKKKKKKAKRNMNICNDDKDDTDVNFEVNEGEVSEEPHCHDINVEEKDLTVPPTNIEKTDGKKKKNKKTVVDEHTSLSDETEIDVNLKLKEMKISDKKCIDAESSLKSPLDTLSKKSENTTENTKKKSGKLKGTRKLNKPATDEAKLEAENPSTACEKCGKDFYSRNKLFNHLKESGHAIYKSCAASTEASSKSNAKAAARNKRLNR